MGNLNLICNVGFSLSLLNVLQKKLLQGKLISLQYYHEVCSDALYFCFVIVKMDGRESISKVMMQIYSLNSTF